MLVPTRRSVLGRAAGAAAAAGVLPWLVGCGDSGAAPGAAPGATGSAGTFPAPLRADQQVTIRFENYNLASAGIGRDATLEMIAAFERKFPNIKVDAKATRDQEIFPSVQAQVVAGTPPDVVQFLLREWDLNVENLPVVPLDELVSPEELRLHLAGKHAFHPRAVALTQRKSKTYGLAYVFSTPTLFYNATLFGQAGLDPAVSPQTWEEVAAAATQIKERTGNDGLYIACIENDWCAQGILLSNGARVMSPDRTKVSFGEPAAVDVYRFWQGLVRSGAHSSLSSADAQAAFQAGKVGMLLQTSAVQGALLGSAQGKFELRSAGMPRFGARPAVPVNSGSGLGILSQDPAKRRAAWELVKHLTSEDAFQVITTQIGYLPLRPGMLDDEQYLKNWPNRSVILPNIRQLDELQPSLSYPGQNHLRIRDLFLDTLQRVLYRGEDAARTFADAQTRAQALMPPPAAR